MIHFCCACNIAGASRTFVVAAQFAATLADPDRFLLISEWDSQETLDAHYRSQTFARFQFDLHGLLAQQSDMTIYAVSEHVRPVNTRPMDPRDAD